MLPYSEQRYVAEVTTPDRQVAGPVRWAPWPTPQQRAGSPRIALLDVGVKTNIVRSLVSRGCHVDVLPYGASAAKSRAPTLTAWWSATAPATPSRPIGPSIPSAT